MSHMIFDTPVMQNNSTNNRTMDNDE